MVKPLTQAALAHALGLAPSRITAMKSEGMPTHSVEAARQWRAQVRPYMKPAGPNSAAPPEPDAYLDGLEDGWAAAYTALQAFAISKGITRFGPALEGITDDMPSSALLKVPPDPAIEDAWDELHAEYERLMAGAGAGS